MTALRVVMILRSQLHLTVGLLKTVFEVNLSLFQAGKNKSHDRSLLLFVIRDHIGATPLQNLENTLVADLNKLWDSLAKVRSSLIIHYRTHNITAGQRR